MTEPEMVHRGRHLWPGWKPLPGLELAPWAQRAREQGQPAGIWLVAGRDGPDGYCAPVYFRVCEDGTIPMRDGWAPVIEDGVLTGFTAPSGALHTLVLTPALVLTDREDHLPDIPSPAIVCYYPEDALLAAKLAEVPDVLQMAPDEPPAALTIAKATADGSQVVVMWGITTESADDLLSVMRARHGEPHSEMIMDHDAHVAIHEVAAERAVMTCHHHEEGA